MTNIIYYIYITIIVKLSMIQVCMLQVQAFLCLRMPVKKVHNTK